MSDIRNIRNISATLFPISPGQGFAGAISKPKRCFVSPASSFADQEVFGLPTLRSQQHQCLAIHQDGGNEHAPKNYEYPQGCCRGQHLDPPQRVFASLSCWERGALNGTQTPGPRNRRPFFFLRARQIGPMAHKNVPNTVCQSISFLTFFSRVGRSMGSGGIF
jgi:hypothetical protein